MTENLAFERWCSTVDLDIQFHRDKQRYHYTTTQLAWAAWEARAIVCDCPKLPIGHGNVSD